MESEDISFENSCRLCLKRIKGEVPRGSIFETGAICHSSIRVKIKTCVCIDVQAGDLLPQRICRDCHNKLDDFFVFKQVCLAADLKLKILLLRADKRNGITNRGAFEGSYGDATEGSKSCEEITIQRMPPQVTISLIDTDMFEPCTVKTEPYSEEECGLAVAMELDALSNDSDDVEIGALTYEPSATTERLPIRILEPFSLTWDNQKIHEIEVKVEPDNVIAPDDDSNGTATTEDLFRPIKSEITEHVPLNEDTPLAHYLSRKIIGVDNGNFIFNIINDKETSDNRPTEKPPTKKCLYKKYNTFRKNYQCNTCIKSFRRLSDLQAHHDTHLPAELKRFTCCVCPETFSEKRYLEEHEKTHTAASFFRCKQCTTSCLTLRELKQHVKTHGECATRRSNCASFVCVHCKRKFRYGTPYRNHVSVCARVRSTKNRAKEDDKTECRECGETVSRTRLHVHRRIVHSKAQPVIMFDCNLCGITFEHKGALICHQATHHRGSADNGTWIPRIEPIFKCVMCEVTCPRKKDLNAHEAYVHGKVALMTRPADTASQAQSSDSQTFLCEPCNVRFQHKGALICHQAFYHRVEMNRNVAQAKTFTCEVCQVVFARKDHYILHKESHKYNRPAEGNGSAVNQLHNFVALSQNYRTEI